MDIKKTIEAFDDYLAARGESFDAVIVGGAALNLLEVTSRVTRDVDVLKPNSLLKNIRTHAQAFASEKNLPKDWLNTGPADLVSHLPNGWETRTRTVFSGQSLSLSTLGREELLMSKCWAYCDRERDLDDIVAMRPTKNEIQKITEWLKPLDTNPQWPEFVEDRMQRLAKKCEKFLGSSLEI